MIAKELKKKKKKIVNALQNMTKKLNISLIEAMDILEVPYKQRERIQSLVEIKLGVL